MVKYQLKEVKTILNTLPYIDSWFWCRFTLNPYNGCEHACTYCDARSNRYYLHQDFEESIYVKSNSPSLLETKLKAARSVQRDVIAFGGTCDAYHPAEDLCHITEKLLKIVLKYRYPLVLSTKATLIQRDFPLLDAIGEAAYCTVGFTITTMDPQIAKFLEPRVDFGIKRLDLIRKIRSHYPHIQVGINFMPMIPLLEDTEANIESIISKSAAAGAQFVQGGPGVTLRDRQADFFYQAFEQYNPNLYQQFRMFWKNNPPNSPYYREKNQFFRDICLKYQIPMRAKRWIPNDFRKENYLIAEDLLNRAYYAQIGGQPYSDMQWAGFTIQNLKENLFHLLEKQELTQIITPRNATDRVRIIIAEYHKSHTPESGLDHFLNKSK